MSQSQFLDHSSIQATIQNYLDGFLGQDPSLLRKAFSPHAKLISITEGKVDETLCTDWFAKVEARRQSGHVPATAQAVISGIDQADGAAVAKVEIKFPTYAFVDYLSLLKTQEDWIIVNKIYVVRE